VHIESGDALDNDLHETSRLSRLMDAARREPRLLVDTEERARREGSTIPGFRARLPRQTVCGLTGTKILTTTDEQTLGTMSRRRSRVHG